MKNVTSVLDFTLSLNVGWRCRERLAHPWSQVKWLLWVTSWGKWGLLRGCPYFCFILLFTESKWEDDGWQPAFSSTSVVKDNGGGCGWGERHHCYPSSYPCHSRRRTGKRIAIALATSFLHLLLYCIFTTGKAGKMRWWSREHGNISVKKEGPPVGHCLRFQFS